MHILATARRIRDLSWSDRLLICEALGCLAYASLAISLVPFHQVLRMARSPRRASQHGDRAAVVERVGWAVTAASNHVPWRTVCFQRGLTLHLLLRRRGIGAQLHYGLRQREDALDAHVWVSVDGELAIGGAEAADFECVSTHPPERA